MLELYHGGHTTCSRKARLCLKEKGLAYTSHFLNLRGFEQHTPAYLKLNPNGVVPTLIDDGEAIVDSMLINEYLDEKYDQHTRLRPNNPLDKARMRVWTKLASDHGLAGVVPRVWPSFKAYTDKLNPNELKEKLGRIPLTERQERWAKVARGGFGEQDLDGRPQGGLADPHADGSRARARSVADGRAIHACRHRPHSVRRPLRRVLSRHAQRHGGAEDSRPGSRACASGRR